ncbi:GSCOCG00001999001-RA-CDS [Cotesia congregata]|nr:GSCOCG00001999001-RA-CDS [Cotesia congregata]
MNYNKFNNSSSEISLNFNNSTSSKNNYFHPSSSNSKSTLNSLEIASDEDYNYYFLSLRPEFDENSANDDQKPILSSSSENNEFVPRKKQTISGFLKYCKKKTINRYYRIINWEPKKFHIFRSKSS